MKCSWKPHFPTVSTLLLGHSSSSSLLWNAKPFSVLDLLWKIMQSWCHHNNVRRLGKHMRHWKWVEHQAEQSEKRSTSRANGIRWMRSKKKHFWMDYCNAFKNATEGKHMRICCILLDRHIRVLCVMWCDVKLKRFTGIIRGRKWNWTAAKLSN